MSELTKENFLEDLRCLIEQYDGFMSIEDGDNYADTDCNSYENYWSEPYKVFEIIFGNTVEPSEGVVLEREGFTVTVDDFEKIVDG